MKYLRYALLAVVLILSVTVALANRAPVSLSLWPDTVSAFTGFGVAVTLPLFAIVGLSVALGLVLGLVWEWLRERGQRVDAKRNRRELDRLRADQNAAPAAPAAPTGNVPRDRVLAILDEKDS